MQNLIILIRVSIAYLLISILIINSSVAQVLVDSLRSKIDSLENVNKVLKDFNTQLARDTSGTVILGKIKLTDSIVYIHNFDSTCNYLERRQSYENNRPKSVAIDKIKEVMLRVEDAGIYDIRVETESGLVFINQKVITPLLNWEKRNYRKKLQISSISYKQCGSYNAYIYIEDFLDYKANRRYRMDDMPVPAILTLKKDSLVLTSGSKLENLANFRIYSDLLALVNETPNGLVQFEADALFYINLNPWRRMYWIKYIKPFLHLSKYDSDSKYLTLDGNEFNDKTAIEFLQKTNVYSGVEVNLLSRVTRDGNTNFDLNGGGAFFFAPYLTDTLGNSENIQAISYFANLKLVTRRIHNFIFDYGFTLMWTVPYESEEVIFSNKNYLSRFMTGEIRYITSEKDQLFLRARYVGDGKNAFNQIQFGYKAQIPIPSTKGLK